MMYRNARIVGNGEQTVVLSHGYGGSQSVWDYVVPHLSRRYQVLLFDWNFSGTTDDSGKALELSKYSFFTAFADELISLIDEMDLGGVIFIGHSMSGMIGCIASVRRPDLFSQLVLIGASPRYLNSEDYEGGFERMEVEKMFADMESNFQSWARGFVALAMHGVNDPISIEKFQRSFLQMRPDIALSVARLIFLSDMTDVLEKVEIPCTIIQGTNDIVVPTSVAHYMQHKMKGKAMVETIRSDGHFPQLTAHQMINEALDRVLAAMELQKVGQVSNDESGV